MFSRRRRAASNPPPNRGPVTANPTAALAASQAFLKNANSNASLSSAAAAAALRSHQSSPTPVHTIQTKRMQRRASVASGASAATAPTMQRRMSNGSMSDRTFRSPSPARSSDNGVAADTDAPPVPAIPRDMSPMPKGKRAASADLPPTRVASPNPRKPGARPVSVDAGNRKPASNVPQRNRASTLSQVTEMDDSGSQKSINFSRPMSPRVTPTPPATPSPIKTSHSGWYTTPVVNDVKPREEINTKMPLTGKKPTSETTGLETSIHKAANQPVKKKKKKASGGEGSHLAGGTMGAKPTGTAVDNAAATPTRPKSPVPKATASVVPDSPQSSELSDSSDSEGATPAKPAALVRQPSTVMEQPEAEEQAEDRKVVTKVKKVRPKGTSAASRVAPAKAHVAEVQKARNPARSSKQSLVVETDAATLRGAGRSTGHERQSSLSPGRQAHFVSGLVEPASGIKHQPPPRSVSPAKSALKHSPSSARTGSPIPLRMTQTPSDGGSDTGSDRGRNQKKKKSVRVSFDDSAAGDDESPSAQPAGLDSSRWSGRTLRGEEEDLDEIMKPRPALPMFGSIRRERRDRVEECPQKVTETVTSSMSNFVNTVVEPMEASTDRVVGGVLAENFASGNNNKDTVAPGVVNEAFGVDYNVDSKEMESIRKTDTDPVAKALEGDNSRSVNISEEKPDGSASGELMDVPTIAVQPATPGTEAETGLQLEIPGSWSGDREPADGSSLQETLSRESNIKSHRRLQPDGGPDPIEPSITFEQYLESDGEEEDEEEEDDTDEGSVYSDAAESLVEGDEGGFASLNAIVESPSIGATASPPESPEAVKTGRGDKIRPPHNETNWDQAKSYWSGLNAQSKAGKENSANSELFESENRHNLESEPALKEKKPKKKKKKAAVFVEPANAASTAATRIPRQPPNQSAQPKKSALKSSMRAPRPEEPVEEGRPIRMRASMRDAPPAREGGMRTTMRQGSTREGGMRSSMRGSPPSREGGMRTSMRSPPTGLAASRYSDTAMESREQKGALQKRNIPMPVQKPVPAPTRRSAANVVLPQQRMSATMPALGRTLSNDSDASVSSFKRARRPSGISEEGRYSMRRSMRNSVSEAPTMRSRSPVKSPVPGASRSSRLSIRSLSPTGNNLFGRRTLAAQNQDSSFPTLRSSQPPPTKSARFSMPAKSSKQGKPAKNNSARFKSRFADSDDSDDDVPALPRFRSRFADSDDESDDEAMHANLRPVRGIPRPAGQEDGDSTDLEEELEESGTSRPPTSGTAPPPPPVPSSQDIERALPKGGLHDSKHAPKDSAATPRKEKRGFFGLGKKRHQQPQRPSTPTTGTAPASSGSPQTNGKLQRRTASQPPVSSNDANWPLTSLPPVPPIPADESELSEARPETSDGIGLRPKLAKRLSAAGGSERGGVKSKDVFGRSGKKKKFGKLRRVFGLTD